MKYLTSIFFTIAMSTICTASQAQATTATTSKQLAIISEPAIIPEPQLVISALDAHSSVSISNETILVATGSEELKSATFFKEYLARYYEIDLAIVGETAKKIAEKSPGKIAEKSANKTERSKRVVIDFKIEPLSNVAIKFPKVEIYNPSDLTKEGAYYLEVANNKITLTGANPQGLFYAMQTLIQLLPIEQKSETSLAATNSEASLNLATIKSSALKTEKKLNIAQIQVLDFPRFEYRGMHLDVVRHIYPVDYVKQYIDYLALHKMNYFHWHLTDDQGWRMESKSHPKLNEIGSWRAATIIGLFPGTGVDSTRYGGFYTIEQMKEIVEYAAQRYITIVPEIDVPGHSMAILAAYPQFSTTPEIPKYPAITWGIYNRQNNVLAPSEEMFGFLEDVFNELMDIFPGPYIHIGADECAKKWWQESPKTQEFMKEYGLENEDSLQKYFAQRIAKVIHARGRQFIGWDEMLDDGLVDGAIVMSWRNAENGLKAAQLGHKTIMTPMINSYMNIKQKENEDTLCHISHLVTLEGVYNFEPIPEGTPSNVSANILGGQGCMWTEYFPHRQRLEYAIFPRMSAIAEVYWSLPKNKNLDRFKQKLNTHQYPRYTLWGANFYRE